MKEGRASGPFFVAGYWLLATGYWLLAKHGLKQFRKTNWVFAVYRLTLGLKT